MTDQNEREYVSYQSQKISSEHEKIDNSQPKMTRDIYRSLGLLVVVGFFFASISTFGQSGSDLNISSSFQEFQLGSFNKDDNSLRVDLHVKDVKIGKLSELSSDESAALFEKFKVDFDRKYDTAEEENERYQNFLNFLKTVDNNNSRESRKRKSSRAFHGITKFADRSKEEMSKMLGYKASKDLRKLNVPRFTVTIDNYAEADASKSVSWAGVYTTSIKDQGYCGSCWAFSGVSQLESDSIRYGYTNTSLKLSEQEIVSCDSDDESSGCDGGFVEGVFEYAYSTGLVTETSYPYTSYYDVTGLCYLTDDMTQYVGAANYTMISGDNTTAIEKAMLAHILTTGPLAISVYADGWHTYSSGVLSVCSDDSTMVDHAVQLVGYESSGDYWIIRNSWGTDWGEDGYIYLAYGENLCDITDDPLYSTPTYLQ